MSCSADCDHDDDDGEDEGADGDVDEDRRAVQVICTNPPIAILPLGYELPAQPSPKDSLPS